MREYSTSHSITQPLTRRPLSHSAVLIRRTTGVRSAQPEPSAFRLQQRRPSAFDLHNADLQTSFNLQFCTTPPSPFCLVTDMDSVRPQFFLTPSRHSLLASFYLFSINYVIDLAVWGSLSLELWLNDYGFFFLLKIWVWFVCYWMNESWI